MHCIVINTALHKYVIPTNFSLQKSKIWNNFLPDLKTRSDARHVNVWRYLHLDLKKTIHLQFSTWTPFPLQFRCQGIAISWLSFALLAKMQSYLACYFSSHWQFSLTGEVKVHKLPKTSSTVFRLSRPSIQQLISPQISKTSRGCRNL